MSLPLPRLLAPALSRAPARPRRRRWWLLAALAVLLLAVAERGWRRLPAWISPPAGDAAWIWSGGSVRQVEPQAFYAVRDFSLPEVPPRARLLVQGDEQYLLFLNGNRVGSNAYAAGAPLDLYDVTPLLLPGANRLVAELRSSRGAGGFLLALAAGGEPVVVSDGGWRIFHAFDAGLVGGWRPLAAGEPPEVWGRPPIGRWGRPQPGPLRPLHGHAAAGAPLEPVASRPVAGDPRGPEGEWVLWDWGREVTGYLTVAYRGRAPGAAVFFARLDPPPPSVPAADGYLVAPPGAPGWDDAVVRTFRYAMVVGPGRIDSIAVLPVREDLAAALGPPPPEEGLLGIEVPRRLSPLEKTVRGGGE